MLRPVLFALALSLAAAGCNWSDLDAEFLAGMPERDDLHVHPPTETASSQQGLTSGDLGQGQGGLTADAFLNLDNMGKQINAWIDGLTGGLDLVRQYPPSVREENRRTWGPYDDKEHLGKELQVVVKLEGDAYQYLVGWRAKGTEGEFTNVIEGSFTGSLAKGGAGSFTLFMDRARDVGVAGPNPDPKYEVRRFTLSYAHPDGGVLVQLTELVVETGTGDLKTLEFRHQRNKDEGATFHYTFTMPRNGYVVTADANWLASHAGRVDGTGYSTFFEKIVANHTECWNEQLEVVYHHQDYDCGPPFNQNPCDFGDAALCVPKKDPTPAP